MKTEYRRERSTSENSDVISIFIRKTFDENLDIRKKIKNKRELLESSTAENGVLVRAEYSLRVEL